MNKLFAFDIDGTLLNDKKIVLNSTKEAISKILKNGDIVCLSTGRTPIQTFDLVFELGLKHFIIGSGGATIYDIQKNEYEIICDQIPKKDLNLIWNYAKKCKREIGFNNGINFWKYYFGKDLLSEVKDELFYIGGTSRFPIYDDKRHAKKAYKNQKIIQSSIKLESFKIDELLNTLKPKLSSKVDVHITSRVYFEVSPKNINKYNAIKKLQQQLNITNENTYCFGDSHNDMEMIKYCGNGIAMGNAIKEIKDCAKFIIGNNNENSIYNFLLNQKLI